MPDAAGPEVALVAPYPPPDALHAGSSGVASYSANLARSLVAAGADVTVIAPREDGVPEHSTDGPIRVQRAFDRGPGALPQAARAAARTGAVVHLQHETFLYGGASALPGLLGGLAWLRRRRPVVVTMHQVVEPGTIDASFTRLHRVPVPAAAARGALALLQGTIPRLATSTLVLEDRFRDAVPRSVHIPHGVEAAPVVDRDAARAAIGAAPDELVALCFGYLAPYKGLETALEAASLLRAAPSDAARRVRLVVAGGPHPRLAASGDDYADRLRHDYQGSARFTGYVADTEVHPLFAAADVVLVLYPRPFSSSGAMALALAHDRPVLLSDALVATLGASPELGGASSPATLAERLRLLAADPAAGESARRASRRLATGRSWPEVAQRHLDLYEEVLDGHRPVQPAPVA